MKQSMYYVHDKNPSFLAHATKLILKIALTKDDNAQALELNSDNARAAKIPKKYFKEFKIDTFHVSGRNVYSISPKEKVSDKVILYLHGGAYINNIITQHWWLIAALIRKTNAKVIVPDYPLAPQYTVKDAMPFLDKVYALLQTKSASKNLIFIGDSAGGGLALAFAQNLKQKAQEQAAQIILLSPWLDISNSNSEMLSIEKKDHILGIKGLKAIGKLWLGELSASNYLVSPIYGDLEDLGTISVFIGGHDIFIADTNKFKRLLEQKNITFNYFEYPKMFHVWIAATYLKESKLAINQISELILKR
jgi:acetyl esterase/lipase